MCGQQQRRKPLCLEKQPHLKLHVATKVFDTQLKILIRDSSQRNEPKEVGFVI